MTAEIPAGMSHTPTRDLEDRSEAGIDLLPRALLRGPTLAIPVLLALLTVAAAGARDAGAPGPTLAAAPTVAGQATQGGRLRASPGSWTGSGKIRYAYQWYRCDTMGAHCALLQGVTRRDHRLGVNDVGHTLSLAVRAADAAGSNIAYATLVGPIAGRPPLLVAKVRPAIFGAAVPGGTLHVRAGVWRPRPTSFSFQWARCNRQGRLCAPIGGATAAAYDVGAGDLGHTLVAIVQARAGTVSRAVFSVATPAAAAARVRPAIPARHGAGPSSSAAPAVAEVLQEGKQIVGAVGSWSGSGTITYAYQWYRCDPTGSHCMSIHGATGLAYTEVAKDVGQTLGFAVRATDATGTTSAYASLVGPVAGADAALASTGQPAISSTSTPGQTLSVSAGSWTEPPASLSYQWQRCKENGRLCSPIAGATASTYTPAAADTGHALIAVVSATVGDVSQAAFSAATRPVAPASDLASSAQPAVSGLLQQGKQLAAVAGSWSGSGTITYAYQWYRCDSAGAHCKSIHGATTLTYTEVAKDVGQTLGFAVQAADPNGTATAYAGLVGPVAAASAPLVATTQPAVAGTATQGQTLQVSNGSWSQAPTSFGYQWQRCNANGRICTVIAGATASTYAVTAADAGHSLQALVAATANGATQATLSSTTAAIP